MRLADQARTIRMPVHMVENINKLVRVQRQLLQDIGREPTPEEIAAEMGISPEKVREIQKISQEPTSLHQPVGDDGDALLGDFIEDKDAIRRSRRSATSCGARRSCSCSTCSRIASAASSSCASASTDGHPRTLEEVGQTFGVTRERIRQIEAKTLVKLKAYREVQRLHEFLD